MSVSIGRIGRQLEPILTRTHFYMQACLLWLTTEPICSDLTEDE